MRDESGLMKSFLQILSTNEIKMEGIQSYRDLDKLALCQPEVVYTVLGYYYGRNWMSTFVLVKSCYDLSNTKAWTVLQGDEEISKNNSLAMAQAL